MNRTSEKGFSVIELALVAGVSVVVTATMIPNFINGISNMRLRSSMTSLAGVIQNSRVLSIKQNRAMTTHFSTISTGILAYVKNSTDTSAVARGDSQIELEAPVTKVTTPSGTGAPSALSATDLGFTAQTGDPSFTPTGLPCVYSSGTCPNAGFIYYFHDTRPAGKMGWAALSISPAGRLKKWFWNGTDWTD